MADTSRTIVITGASDGIGASAARTLSQDGHRVVVVGRHPERTSGLAAELGADHVLADFTRLDEVRALAATLLDRYPRIDVLANNAGVYMGERRTTPDGYEQTFQVNHLAPFLLTSLLLDRLRDSGASVVMTSSHASMFGTVDLRNLQGEKSWSSWRAYGNSKLMNVLFTRGLHRRHVLEGISAAAFHPGPVASSFAGDASGLTGWLYRSRLGRRLMITPEQGADTLVWLAEGTPPRDWASGQYYAKRTPRRPNSQALDDALVDAFWDVSARLVL